MAWVACDGTNNEMIFEIKPRRNKKFITWDFMEDTGAIFIPSGSIEKLIGRKLTWEDEPVELTDVSKQREQLIAFLRQQSKLHYITIYENDFEFADKLLKAINCG